MLFQNSQHVQQENMVTIACCHALVMGTELFGMEFNVEINVTVQIIRYVTQFMDVSVSQGFTVQTAPIVSK